jgi:hypothetical protein
MDDTEIRGPCVPNLHFLSAYWALRTDRTELLGGAR